MDVVASASAPAIKAARERAMKNLWFGIGSSELEWNENVDVHFRARQDHRSFAECERMNSAPLAKKAA